MFGHDDALADDDANDNEGIISMDDITDAVVLNELSVEGEEDNFTEDHDGKRFMMENGILNKSYSKNDFSLILARLYYERSMFGLVASSGSMTGEHVKMLQHVGANVSGSSAIPEDEDALRQATAQAMESDLACYHASMQFAEQEIMQLQLQKKDNEQGSTGNVNKLSDQILNVRLPSALPSDTSEFVVRAIGQQEVNNGQMDATSIFNALIEARPEHTGVYSANLSATLSYIDAIITIYSSYFRGNSLANADTDYYRMQKVRNLLRREYDNLATYRKKLEEGKLHYVLQIVQCDGEYAAACPACGKYVPLRTVLNVLSYPKDRTQESTILPIPVPVDCSCGESLVLTGMDVFRIHKILSGNIVRDITKYNEIALSLSQRAPISHFTVTSAQLANMTKSTQVNNIPLGIFVEDTLEKVEVATENDAAKEVGKPIHLCGNTEYLDAVRIFYDSLHCVNPKYRMYGAVEAPAGKDGARLSDPRSERVQRISYEQITRFICDVCGLSYVEFKNRAIFSLVYLIKENSFLEMLFDKRTVWAIEKELDSMAVFEEYNGRTFPEEMFPDLLICYNKISDVTVCKEDLADRAKVHSILAELKERKKELEEEYRKTKEMQGKAFSTLKECERALRFTKIINISSAKFSELAAIIDSQEMLEYLDRVADQMIICNFANKFYYKWKLLNNRQSNFLKDFEEALDDSETTGACVMFLGKMSKVFSGASDSASYDYFKFAGSPSLEHFRNLKEVEYGTKNMDPFAIGASLEGLSNVEVGQLGAAFTKRFEGAVKEVTEAFRPFAGDQHEGPLKAAGFSQDEIDEYRDIDSFCIHGHLLMRQPGETLEQYLIRVSSDKAGDTVDYAGKFRECADALLVVSIPAILNSVDYDSFISAAFMISLSDMCVHCMYENEANQVLAINSTLSRKLEDNCYRLTMDCKVGRTMEKLFNNYYYNELDYLTSPYYEAYCGTMVNMNAKIDNSVFSVDGQLQIFRGDIEKRALHNAPIMTTRKNGEVDYLTDVPYDSIMDNFEERVVKL